MPDKINPWLLRRTDSPSTSERTDEHTEPVRSGPSQPQRGGRVPQPTVRLGVHGQHDVHQQHQASPTLWVLGVHGGAGESTIASLRPGWAAAGHGLPATIPSVNRTTGPDRLLLTCRSHVPGLLAAQAAATQWAGGDARWLELLGLVIIADAPGKSPKPVRDLAGVVAGGVPRCWRLPWFEAWRLGDSPPITDLPRPVRRLLTDLDALTTRSTATGPGTPSYAADPVSLEGIHHASPRHDHPVRPSGRGPHPAADPR